MSDWFMGWIDRNIGWFFVVFMLGVLFVLTAGIHSCVSDPPPANAPERKPFLVSEQDGVKLYGVRHYDTTNNYRIVYFTVPNGDVEWDERSGKTTIRRKTTSGIPK